MEQLFTIITEFATTMGLRILGALLLLIIGFKVINSLVGLIGSSKRFSHVDPSVRSFVRSFVAIALKVVLIISGVGILGVELTTFAALLASAGVAIGLAFQGALSNFAGGLMILFFRPFKVGDFVQAPAGTGTVKDITVIYTILTTPDNRQITIPNGALMNAAVTNFSTEAQRRITLTASVAAGIGSPRAKELLLAAADKQALALKTPAPAAILVAADAASIKFSLEVWCNSEDYDVLSAALIEEVKVILDAVAPPEAHTTTLVGVSAQ